MRYKILRMDQYREPFGREETIYIIPRGADPDQFLVIYPAKLEQELKKLIISGQYSIRAYEGLQAGAVEDIRESLLEKASAYLNRIRSRGANMFATGTVLAVFGLLNWFIPDPLPLVDEMILTFGGAAVALAGFARRMRGYEEFERRTEIVRADVLGIPEKEDPFLSHCAAAIRDRHRPGEGDLVEQESRWLVKYTDLDALITSGTVTKEELIPFFRLLKKLIPLETLSSKTWWGERQERNRRKGLIRRLQYRYGFTTDALALYTALYKAWKEDYPA